MNSIIVLALGAVAGAALAITMASGTRSSAQQSPAQGTAADPGAAGSALPSNGSAAPPGTKRAPLTFAAAGMAFSDWGGQVRG